MKSFVDTYAEGTEERKKAEIAMEYVGANIEELYLTSNFLSPYLLWDGGFTTLELLTLGEDLKVFDQYNGIWTKLKNDISKLKQENSYTKIFYMMSNQLKFAIYDLYMNEIPGDQAYKVFKDIYSSSEYNFDLLNWEDIKELCQEQNQNDIKLLKKKFGNEITIYRGETHRSDKEGYSWTTNYDIADWFAKRFESNGVVLKGKVNADDVLTFFDNKESEVLVPRDLVQIIDDNHSQGAI
ncbi:hypothetical protein AAGG74_16285 [Bacillus mexicanus]|uniref:hypothetical protein n=1 Tax=Bacillus mexicanus TaxID=2834415 RepID=UPI003D1B572C